MSEVPEDDPVVRASLLEQGLLSPVIEEWRVHYLVQHAEWFDFAHTVNKLAMKLWIAHWDDMQGEKITALKPTASRVFVRAINNFAATVILCERGLAIEAAALARSISEASIWLGYMVEKPDKALSDLEADDLHNFIGRHKELRRVSEKSGDTASVAYTHVEEKKLRAALNGRNKPNWQTIAQDYGSSSSYMKFRIISGFYSHLSVASLQHHIHKSGDDTAFNILGPHSTQIPHALYFACDALTYCGAAYSVIVDDHPLTQAFHDTIKPLNDLRNAMPPQSA
ncbi:DUF5677 domain-containing protein [Brevundimonas nasdae]|uniref:DUF5677 domain-containing protein n=1 Tax=Brevundimonas nasdae TaxID=172043 RepID=UPI003F68F967